MPFAERGGVRVHYELVGVGPPVVMLPGAGTDGSFWRKAGYVDALAGEYCCIAIDPRGFGLSSRPLDPEAMRPQECAADVLAVVDALGLDRFALWGQSAGGVIAMMLAAAHPSRATALVGSGAAPDLDERGWGEWRSGVRDLAAAARTAGSWRELIEGVAAQEGLALPGWVGDIDCDLELLARLVERLPGGAYHPEWRELEAPCLLLLGELETDAAWVERATQALPLAQIVVFPELGHVGAILAAEPTLAQVRPFLARHLPICR